MWDMMWIVFDPDKTLFLLEIPVPVHNQDGRM